MASKETEIRRPDKQGVIFVIFDSKTSKVLVEDRTNREKTYFGYIIFPGGKVEDGEDHDQAVIREIFEECDIVPRELVLLDNFLHCTISGNLYNTTAYLVTGFEGEVKNKELGKSKQMWVSLDEAASILPFVDSKYLLNLAMVKLKEKKLV